MSDHHPVASEYDSGPDLLRRYGLDRLSTEERVALAEELFDSVEQEQTHSPLTPAQVAEIERRIAYAQANPGAGLPVQEAIERALARRRR